MTVLGASILAGASGNQGYNLTRSLRFRSSASAYLNRTPASAGNQQKFTWSGWVKRGTLGTSTTIFGCYSSGTLLETTYFDFRFNVNSLDVNWGNGTWFTTTAVYRDPSAWYHIVLAVDTTQATASNRMILYVNGVQVTAFSYTSYPAQNTNLVVNTASGHTFGKSAFNSSAYLDGYLAEVNFIDGQALTPSSFGETSPNTGVWIPKKYAGTYGTNGFYLPFTNTSSTATLGNDFSGNNNTWTVNNISLTSGVTYDSMTDVPTLTNPTTANYCTLNPIIPIPRGTISQGNLNYLSGSTSSHGSVAATFTLPTTGKWYWEVTACNNSGGSGNNEVIGVANILNNPQLPAAGSEIGSGSRGDYAYRSDGNKYSNGNQGAYGATYTNGDVIGVAWDSDSGTITFYKNNVSQGTAFSSITQVAGKFAPASSNAETSNGDNYNFGQRPFAYTPPTGFVALNTFNLPTPTIGATASTTANKYMNATLYTGTGSAQSITNSGSMQPDLVWIKGRNAAKNHTLVDSVRGATKNLVSNSINPEGTWSSVTAFNSNGFTLGTDSNENGNTDTFVAWQWRASNATGVTNTAGSITSTVSANTTAGFSIVRWTSNNTGSPATVGHGLGVAPSMVITKSTSNASGWEVYHASLGATKFLQLNSTSGEQTSSGRWNNTAPTSSVFTVGTDINFSTYQLVGYCFAQVAGYSAFGSYVGNSFSAGADGIFVYLGFRPRFVLVKLSSSSGYDWVLYDSARSPTNVTQNYLNPNNANSENAGGTVADIDFLSNGFKLRNNSTSAQGTNIGNQTYIYAAFAESPFKYANAR